MFIGLQVRAKRTARDEIGELIHGLRSQSAIQRVVRHGTKVATADGVSRDWLNQRFSPEKTIAVKQFATFANQLGVSKVERTVQVAQVKFAEIPKKCKGIVHVSGWQSSSAAKRAMSRGTSQ